MPTLPFASLTPLQQTQVTRIFQDTSFGTDPATFVYELEAATGQLSGQRSQVSLLEKKIQHGKRSPLIIKTAGQVQLSDLSAHVLARMSLPHLLSDPEPSTSPALADLPVAGSSLPVSGWSSAGDWLE